MAKRVFDLFFSVVGLLVLSPVLLVLAVLVKVSDGGPVLFRQQRVGKDGRPFYIVKFRSMVENADDLGLGVTRDGDPRITAMGRFLRKTKLDELPQLWNVLVGDMSFVGPRPEVPGYVARYTAEQRKVLALKPGITDLATLEFRKEEEMLKGEMLKAEMLKAERGKAEDGGAKGKAERGKAERGKAEDGGAKGKAETLKAETLKAETLKAEIRKAEDGGRRTEDGARGTAEYAKYAEEETGDGVERFYLDYCVPRKIELNLAYASRANLGTDMLIILHTLFPFLIRNNSIQPQMDTNKHR